MKLGMDMLLFLKKDIDVFFIAKPHLSSLYNITLSPKEAEYQQQILQKQHKIRLKDLL